MKVEFLREGDLFGFVGRLTMHGPRLDYCLLLALLLACSWTFTGAQKLSITPSGRQIKQRGSGIVFTCSLTEATSYRNYDIRWRRSDGSWITNRNGRVHVEDDGPLAKRLYLNPIEDADAGVYTCQTQLPDMLVSEEVSIAIYRDIEFANTLRFAEHRVGSSPLLPCQASGEPAPTISWRFRRVRLPLRSEKYQYETGGLRINGITDADNGTYECRAEVESQGNLRLRHITLIVLSPAEIVVAPNETSVVEGRRVQLNCLAKGNPPPKYEWYKEQRVNDMYKVKVKLGDGLNKKTHVIVRTTPDDEGLYFCKATNFLGSDEATAFVSLMYPPEIEDLPVKTQSKGDIMMMRCITKGTPVPTIRWQKVGAPAPYREGEQRIPRIIVDNTEPGISKLVISGVLPEDSGLYTCTATNPAGVTSKNGSLTVQYEPSLMTEGREEYGWAGESRSFECEASGVPDPDIIWIRNHANLRHNDTYRIIGRRGNSILQVHIRRGQPWVYGEYYCMAKNIRGYKNTTFSLLEAVSPGMARNVTVADETPTAVTLVAELPPHVGGPEMTEWVIKYKEETDSKDAVERNLYYRIDEKLEIDGLKPDTQYQFYLAVKNAVGAGKALRFLVQTPPIAVQAPTDPPHKTQPNPHGGNQTVAENKQPKGHNILVRKATEKEDDSLPLGFIIGITLTIILLALLVVILFIVFRRRHKRQDNPYGVKTVVRGAKDRNSRDIDSMQLSIRRKNSPLPLPPTTPKSSERKIMNGTLPSDAKLNGHVVHLSPSLGGRPTSDVPTLNCVANPNSEATLAWNQMLQRKDMVDTDEEEYEDLEGMQITPRDPEAGGTFDTSPDNELPPPPPFLLDEEQLVRRKGNRADYQDIFDGYHSGDNIDDDIDEVGPDYAVRGPAYGLPMSHTLPRNEHHTLPLSGHRSLPRNGHLA